MVLVQEGVTPVVDDVPEVAALVVDPVVAAPVVAFAVVEAAAVVAAAEVLAPVQETGHLGVLKARVGVTPPPKTNPAPVKLWASSKKKLCT